MCACVQHGQNIKRADSDELRAIFDKYAKVVVNGEKYMRPEDFIVDYLEIGKEKTQKVNLETAKMLGSILDTSKDGCVGDFSSSSSYSC